ncbi:MAG: class I SAM-dependent methyltransferase [Solirubrobacterales bacterium]
MAGRGSRRERLGLTGALRTAALDLLACPRDHTALELTGGDGGEIADGALRCAEGHRFEIREGVPRLAPEESAGGDSQEGTFESFSAKWAQVSSEELEQRFAQQYEWYVERYGFGDEEGLAEFLSGREAILEAGTGLGGDAARFARLSEAQVVGLDLSEGVVKAQRHFGGPENLHYVQGDILELPFRPVSFDFISSDQVIHHTPDAPGAFARLAERLRPGGHLAVYVYREKAMLRELADTRVREITTRMSPEECMEFSEQVTELGRELSRLGATVNLEKGVPLLGIDPGEHDVQRLIHWTFLKCFWNDDFSEHLNALVNFDWYHPPYASRHTPDEVRGWCERAGLGVEHLDVSESGISVLARRPA